MQGFYARQIQSELNSLRGGSFLSWLLTQWRRPAPSYPTSRPLPPPPLLDSWLGNTEIFSFEKWSNTLLRMLLHVVSKNCALIATPMQCVISRCSFKYIFSSNMSLIHRTKTIHNALHCMVSQNCTLIAPSMFHLKVFRQIYRLWICLRTQWSSTVVQEFASAFIPGNAKT